jgi:hypothetical protein
MAGFCLRDCGDAGGVTEWLMVADCKSAGLTPYVGSNPTPTMEAGKMVSGEVGSDASGGYGKIRAALTQASSHPTLSRFPAEDAGVAQLVEHQPSKLRVAGSSPVARFFGAELTL